MAVEWFCKILGEVTGPFSAHQLKELAQQGRLAPQDQVRNGGDGSWTMAERVKGLFLSVRSVRSESDLPVAQPLEPATKKPTTIRMAEPLNTPSAHAAPQPPRASSLPPPKKPAAGQRAAPPDPFEIHAGGQRPIARATGTGHRKKSRQSTLLVGGSVVVLALCLVIVVVMVDPSMNRPAEDPEPPSTAGRSVEEDLDALIDGPPSRPSDPASDEPASDESPPDESAPEPQEKEITWLPADQPIQVENVSVEILSAKIGPAPVIDKSGEASQYGRNFVLVTIGIQNVDEKDELKYASWGTKGPINEDVSLSDAQGKRYARFRPSNYRIKGELGQETLAPSASVEDVLVFQAPDDLAEGLRLQLPCAAFGEEGSLYLEIPADMIRVAEGSADRDEGSAELPEMGLGSGNTERGGGNSRIDSATPVSDPFDEEVDPDGDVSQISRDIEETGGGEKDPAERAFEEEEDGRSE